LEKKTGIEANNGKANRYPVAERSSQMECRKISENLFHKFPFIRSKK
jgi:hypothetical protein